MDYADAVEVFFTPAPTDVATPPVVAAATPARRLRDALEPLAMHAVWSSSVNAALAGHGMDLGLPRVSLTRLGRCGQAA
jgi:hypothetical protein